MFLFLRGLLRNVFSSILHAVSHVCVFCITVGTIDVGKARLMFWDLGGQEELQSLWDKVSENKYNKQLIKEHYFISN